MNLYLTGDTHGIYDDTCFLFRKPFSRTSRDFTKDDAVLILGDFGWIFTPTKGLDETRDERKMLDYFEKQKWTTLFIDGNHENFDRLYRYPEAEAFGGKVGVVRPSVLHLKERGHIYTIGGRRCFCFGGAYSTDRQYRTEGRSWWPQEMPSKEEYERGLDELQAADWNVDYVFTHDAPLKIGRLVYGIGCQKDMHCKYLDSVSDRLDFKGWYFGHLHTDYHCGIGGTAYRGLYCDIVSIEDPILTGHMTMHDHEGKGEEDVS